MKITFITNLKISMLKKKKNIDYKETSEAPQNIIERVNRRYEALDVKSTY